jgi:MSHA biogenesis protein MshI
MIRWLRTRRSAKERLVVSWSNQTLAYVLARDHGRRGHEVLRFGVERQEEGAGGGGLDSLIQRLKALALGGFAVSVMLRPEQYQLLNIPAPAVAPDELRAAARYQIARLLDTHVDDATIDVMRVGDGRTRDANRRTGDLFVVAAPRAVIRGVLDLCDAMRWTVSVIDIQETAQRDLQSALASREARATLVLSDPFQAILTIVANGELFYTRRFVLPAGFLEGAWAGSPADAARHWPDLAPLEGADHLGAEKEEKEDARAQRFLLEVQRSLDLWNGLWSGLPLQNMSLYAGAGSQALADWLAQQLGLAVVPLHLAAHFAGFESDSVAQQAACVPLLGMLLREHQPAH